MRARPFGLGTGTAAVDLYGLPLGAGGHSARLNGRVFEAVAARVHHRTMADLYHSALEARTDDGRRFVVEMAPVPNGRSHERGVVAEGPVGAAWAGRLRIFRYEVRLWQDGLIPDVAEAVDSPHRLTTDPDAAARICQCVREVPTPVWGRDELGAGEMWNSNSVIAWVIARGGLAVEAIPPPAGGRAPGWRAVSRSAGARVSVGNSPNAAWGMRRWPPRGPRSRLIRVAAPANRPPFRGPVSPRKGSR